jgi:hypothetical protein
MSLTNAQRILLNQINENRRLLTDDEIFNWYGEHVMKNSPSCKWNFWGYYGAKKRGENPKRRDYFEDYSIDEMNVKARQSYRFNLGSLVMKGFLKISFDEHGAGLSGFSPWVPSDIRCKRGRAR